MRQDDQSARATCADNPVEVAQRLATELSRLRQRGIDHVDDHYDRKRPVASPILDDLAEVGGLPYRAGRLKAFLAARLDDFGVTNVDSANFVRRLFYDKQDNAPGPSRPAGLLASARRSLQIEASTFRRMQRQHLILFAAFLLQTSERQPRWREVVRIVGASILLATGLLVLAAVVDR